MELIKNKIDKGVEVALVVMMSLMVINVTWQVISRYMLPEPSDFTEETARFLMVWLGFIGGSYVAGQKMHPAIDLLSTKLSPDGNKKLNVIIQILMITFALLGLVIGGFFLVKLTLTLKQTSAALGVPFWIVYSCVPVSGLLLIFYSIFNIKNYK